ncbi:MAG: hypothetical protein FWD61_11630 [Phycisphaerales bacterium]|nr:hypothetical protein [Phycisphaerales bacterium]
METLLIWLVVLLVVLMPLWMLAGVFVGVWLTYRLSRGASPMPNPGAIARSVIEVVRPPKKESANNSLHLPRMRT